MPERERTTILFSIAAFMASFVYYELGRRQHVSERREEARREYIDNKLAEHESALLAHRERAAARAGIFKALISVAGALAVLIPLIALLHIHLG